MHCIQYATVGDSARIVVYNTERMTDEQIRDKVRRDPLGYGGLPSPATIVRYDRCPECEVWTRDGGKLRSGTKCPAVKEARGK